MPLIAEALAKLRVNSVTLDGEGVACRPDGVSDFDRLRAALGRKGSRDAFLYAFDLLDGQDLRREPGETLRATLASLLRRAGGGIRLSEHLDSTDGEGGLPARLRHGAGRHCHQAPRPAVSVRTLAGLDQDQEPGRAGRE
jgi:ATP-dependent DNA ligase